MKKQSLIYQQVFPIGLTFVSYLILCLLLFVCIKTLNALPLKQNIQLHLHIQDILVGITIYIKTAIDFALFIGNLMSRNRGVQNRLAIEIGTQIGNGIGTLFILTIWYFFKEVPLLLALMIFLASVVLFSMAEEGAEELVKEHKNQHFLSNIAKIIYKPLKLLNKLFAPINKIILPGKSTSSVTKNSFVSLLIFSITIPFILGLDDFAGYIPLFSIINVFGFAIGVLTAHMLLLTFLFLSEEKTAKVVRHPVVILFGSIAFIGIACYGLYEVVKMLIHIF